MTAPRFQQDDGLVRRIAALRRAGASEQEIDAFLAESADPAADPQPVRGANGGYGALASFGSGMAQGASFGFADELAGIGGALTSPLHPIQGYRSARDRIRAAIEKRRQEHPVASLAGEVGGAIVSPVNKLLMPAAGGTGTLSAIRGATAAGAKGGALYGAGVADEISDVPLSGTIGGLAGGVGGAVGSAIVSGVTGAASRLGSTSGGQRIANKVRARMGKAPIDPNERAERKAAEYLVRQLERDRVPLETVGEELAPDDPRLLYNLGGKATTNAARVAQSIPSDATSDVPAAIYGQLEGGPGRLLQATESAIGKPIPNPIQRVGELADEAASAAKPLYERLKNVPVQGDEIKAVLNRPAIRDALNAARKNLLNRGDAVPDEATVGLLDDVKKILDDEIESVTEKVAQGKASGADKSSLKGLDAARRALVDQLDYATAGEYAKARAVAAKGIGKREAFREGTKYATARRDRLETDIPAMSGEQQAAYREGAATSIENVVQSTPDRRNLAARLFGSPAEREKLRTAFGGDPKALATLESIFKQEDALRRKATEALTSGQSMTTPLREAIDEFQGSAAEQLARSTGAWNAAKRLALSGYLRSARNLNSKAAGELGKLLTSKPNPELQRKLFAARLDALRRSGRRSGAGRRTGIIAGLLASGEGR